MKFLWKRLEQIYGVNFSLSTPFSSYPLFFIFFRLEHMKPFHWQGRTSKMHAAAASAAALVRNGFHHPSSSGNSAATPQYFSNAPLPVPPPPPIWSVSVDAGGASNAFFASSPSPPGDRRNSVSPRRDQPSPGVFKNRVLKVFFRDRFLLVRNLPKNTTEQVSFKTSF